MSAAPGGAAPLSWSNWSGSVVCRPSRIERPRDEEELAAGVRRAAGAGLAVRAFGSGHSFSPVAATDGVLMSLDALAGVESHDASRGEAWIRAGSKLHDLGEPLLALGLAMENLGDVDVQSLGGALGTGTHGTGRTLRNLSANVTALRLVDASGEVRTFDGEGDGDLLRAARVSLGMLGVITAARLRLVPAYRLHERVRRIAMEACLEELDAGIVGHRHYEFFWYPRKDLAEVKTLDPTDAPEASVAGREGERIGWSARILPSLRELKFFEMEYAVPAESGRACFLAVRERIRARHPGVAWPVEYRTLAGDDAFLSTASESDRVTLSIHQDGTLPYRDFFADVEPILREFGGRPHWGKLHTAGPAELWPRYPRMDAFLAARARLDPEGRFLNHHLRKLFGLGGPAEPL